MQTVTYEVASRLRYLQGWEEVAHSISWYNKEDIAERILLYRKAQNLSSYEKGRVDALTSAFGI